MRVGAAAALHQRLHIAAGQQVHGQVANFQCQREQGSLLRRGRVQHIGQLGAQLQSQALTQVARAHARRLQTLQQAQCDGKVVHRG